MFGFSLPKFSLALLLIVLLVAALLLPAGPAHANGPRAGQLVFVPHVGSCTLASYSSATGFSTVQLGDQILLVPNNQILLDDPHVARARLLAAQRAAFHDVGFRVGLESPFLIRERFIGPGVTFAAGRRRDFVPFFDTPHFRGRAALVFP